VTRDYRNIVVIDMDNSQKEDEDSEFYEYEVHWIDDGITLIMYPNRRVAYIGTPHEPIHKCQKYKVRRDKMPTIYTPGIIFTDAKN
jgi:hypothetical protein